MQKQNSALSKKTIYTIAELRKAVKQHAKKQPVNTYSSIIKQHFKKGAK